ncbi:hypothetical protein [Acetobacter senegalensis]|uniref:hypothetical protein n=1 Tax=Acetobacter senegalensis TaxID=446692 RepID=UPI001EDBD3D1|nr:hypothetical protein [Acetobacter senegalensis]
MTDIARLLDGAASAQAGTGACCLSLSGKRYNAVFTAPRATYARVRHFEEQMRDASTAGGLSCRFSWPV